MFISFFYFLCQELSEVIILIYHFNQNKYPIWFGKLVESLNGEISKNTISHAIDTLFDWGIIQELSKAIILIYHFNQNYIILIFPSLSFL